MFMCIGRALLALKGFGWQHGPSTIRSWEKLSSACDQQKHRDDIGNTRLPKAPRGLRRAAQRHAQKNTNQRMEEVTERHAAEQVAWHPFVMGHAETSHTDGDMTPALVATG